MISTRNANESDSEDLFVWRNDVQTRRASVSVAPVPWEDHAAWFEAALASTRRYIYIGELDGLAPLAKVGMCRFDVATDGLSAEVSINLNPMFRGKRLAGVLLGEAISQFRREMAVPLHFTATIRSSNPASIRIFESAGFTLLQSDEEFGYYRLP